MSMVIYPGGSTTHNRSRQHASSLVVPPSYQPQPRLLYLPPYIYLLLPVTILALSSIYQTIPTLFAYRLFTIHDDTCPTKPAKCLSTTFVLDYDSTTPPSLQC